MLEKIQKWAPIFSLVLCAATFAAVMLFVSQADSGEKTVNIAQARTQIQANMPNTAVKQINPAPIRGLYEVVTEKGLLYTDKTGQFLFVGGIFDTKNNTDIVAARKDALGFDKIGAAKANQPAKPAQSQRRSSPRVNSVSQKDLAAIDPYTITTQEYEGAPVIYELFDPMCPACRANDEALRDLKVTVKRILVKTAGSHAINKEVYCNEDPAAAIDSLIATNSLQSSGERRANCDTQDLNEIVRWVRGIGMPLSTPQSIIAENGQVLVGARSKAAWNNILEL